AGSLRRAVRGDLKQPVLLGQVSARRFVPDRLDDGLSMSPRMAHQVNVPRARELLGNSVQALDAVRSARALLHERSWEESLTEESKQLLGRERRVISEPVSRALNRIFGLSGEVDLGNEAEQAVQDAAM